MIHACAGCVALVLLRRCVVQQCGGGHNSHIRSFGSRNCVRQMGNAAHVVKVMGRIVTVVERLRFVRADPFNY
jgi:hypothetical protein